MKVVITGANGQLGTDLCKALSKFEVIPLTHKDIEITELVSVKENFLRLKPEVIINTAAYVRVDDCEDNPDKAFQINALGARNVAVVAQDLGAKLVHISTDYVFGGSPPLDLGKSSLRGSQPPPKQSPDPVSSWRRTQPYISVARIAGDPLGCQGSQGGVFPTDYGNPNSSNLSGYTEFDTPSPVNIYGHSKLTGEDFVRHLCTRYFIVRGSGLFGIAGSSGKGGNFVETMLRLGKERNELRVVNDQVFSPTYTWDLAKKIAQLITTEYYGIFHIANSGTCSWYDFTKEIIRLAGLTTNVTPITSDQYPQKARRPAYSVLDHYHLRLLGMDDIPDWREALKKYLMMKQIIR
jgi:dTDP-4-dehydrorhamnose reductase